ncbi:MAG: hypothetical protein ACI4RA_03465, partial [Kiritimatiellia bacterium]
MGALALGTGVALADESVPEVVTDVSGYVELTGGGSNNAGAFAGATGWSDGAAPGGGKDYIVQKNRILRTAGGGGTFAGRSLTLDNGRIKTAGDASGYTLTINDLHMYGGRIEQSTGGSTKTVAGTMHVRGTAANPSRISGCSGRTLRIDSMLEGDETGVVKVMMTEEDASNMNSGFFDCWFNVANAATYRGCFRVEAGVSTTEWGHRIALCASKLANLGAGDPNGTSVITLKDRAAFYGSQGMAFNDPAYSIAIENGGTIGGRHTSGASGVGVTFDCGVAIRGATGADETLSILGDRGAVALNNVKLANIAAVAVEAGTLLLGTDFVNRADAEVRVESGAALGGTTAAGGRVTLASGAQLAPGFGGKDDTCIGQLGVASLTVEAGGRLRYSVIRPGDALSSDFIRVAGDIEKKSTEPIEIIFDRYPNSLAVGTRIPLLSAANLGTGIRPEDFRFSCADSFLNVHIKGAFEVEEIDGAPTLVFVQSSGPVVTLGGWDGGGDDSWAHKRRWSNGQAPSAEFDYLVPGNTLLRRSTSGDPDRFAGRSLSIINGGDFAVCGLTAQVDDLRLFSGGIISTRKDGDANRLKGVATVFAAKGSPFCFEIERGGATATRTLNLEAQFRGAGDLCFRYYHAPESHGKSGEAPNTFYLVTGDNTAFTGGVELRQRAVCVDFKDEAAMGGPAPAFRADRLLFASNATLRCSRSYVMRDPTRGITIGIGGDLPGFDGGTIEVLEGQTLTVSNRIAGVGGTTLRKTGPGTLALCCATNTFSGRIRHQEGVIAVGAADAVAQATLQSPAGALWRVDAPEGMTVKSLDAVLAHEEDGNQALLVRPRAFATQQTTGL